MTRQQRRFEQRNGGPRTIGFLYVPSWREHPKHREPGNGGKRSWAIKPSKSDDPAYRRGNR